MIHHHAIFARDARRARQFVIGHAADAHQGDVAGDDPAVLQTHAGEDAVRSLEPGDGGVQLEADAMAAVQVLEEVGQGAAGDAGQTAGLALDDDGLGAQGAGRGGGLQPHIAAADHGQPRAGFQHRLQGFRIREGAQGEDAGQVGSGNLQTPGPRAGGQDQDVPGKARSIVERDCSGRAVDGGDGGFGAQVDIVLGVPGGGAQFDRLDVRLALQPGLGEGRALVGDRRLVADQDDGPLMAVLAQERRRRPARMARADDDDAGVGGVGGRVGHGGPARLVARHMA